MSVGIPIWIEGWRDPNNWEDGFKGISLYTSMPDLFSAIASAETWLPYPKLVNFEERDMRSRSWLCSWSHSRSLLSTSSFRFVWSRKNGRRSARRKKQRKLLRKKLHRRQNHHHQRLRPFERERRRLIVSNVSHRCQGWFVCLNTCFPEYFVWMGCYKWNASIL